MELPTIALRDLVLFPDTEFTLPVSRPESISSIKLAIQNQSFVFLSLFDEEKSHLSSIGVIAEVSAVPGVDRWIAQLRLLHRAQLLSTLSSSPNYICSVSEIKEIKVHDDAIFEDLKSSILAYIDFAKTHLAENFKAQVALSQLEHNARVNPHFLIPLEEYNHLAKLATQLPVLLLAMSEIEQFINYPKNLTELLSGICMRLNFPWTRNQEFLELDPLSRARELSKELKNAVKL